jgi:hypothetical protein
MKSFEDFYYGISKEEKAMVDRLRNIIQNTSPKFVEKISYGVPYYFLHTRVCYIWPASVKPGPKAGVVLGLCNGQLLSNDQKILELEGRKVIATITYLSLKEIKDNIVREILNEAILVDEELAKSKLKKRK